MMRVVRSRHADALEAIAAHRAATAGKEQPVGRNFREVGPEMPPTLARPGEDETALGSKPEIGPRLHRRAEARRCRS